MSEGTQLASGYVDLTVKYKDAQSQIARTFDGFVNDAEKAGKQAGDAVADGLGDGAKKGAKQAQQYIAQGDIAKTLAKELGSAGDKASKELLRSLAAGNEQAKRNATQAGKAYAAALKAGTSGAGADAARKFESEFRNALHAREASQVFFDEFHRDGVAMGERVGTAIGKTISAGIKIGAAGAAAAVAGIGYTLTKGFERLEKIDQARFKLSALGNSATDVDEIMRNAQESVQGTAFALDQAASSAASAVAAGIKPGKQLTGYLSTVADTAAIAGTSFEDMASIFNKVTTNNKAYTDDLQQLADRGIPIFKYLADQYNVSGSALQKMVEDGKVSAQDFDNALSSHIGGAAQKMGQSFGGAMDNMQASIARLGANFIAGIFGGPGVNPLATPTEAVGKLTEKLNAAGAWVKAHGPEIHDFFIKAKDAGKQFIDVVGPPLGVMADVLKEHPELIAGVAIAFGAWKTIEGVAGLITSLKTISTLLKVELPLSAAAGASGISAALAGVAVPAWLTYLVNSQTPDGMNNTVNGQKPDDASFWDMAQSWMSTGFAQNSATGPFTPGSLGGPSGAQRDRRGASPYNPFPGAGGSRVTPGNVLNPPSFGNANGVIGARGGPTVGGGQGLPGAVNLPAAGGGAESWRPLVRSTVAGYAAQYGITNPKAWEDALVRQINTESGGNAGSVNNHDSNGRGGTQRVAGILNFLESTFNGYNVSGGAYMDPAAQIAAAIPYVMKRWGVASDGSPLQIGRGVGFATGGGVSGPGGPKADRIPAMLSDGEHVWTAAEVAAVGGQDKMYQLRQLAMAGMIPGFNTGGQVETSGTATGSARQRSRLSGPGSSLEALQWLFGDMSPRNMVNPLTGKAESVMPVANEVATPGSAAGEAAAAAGKVSLSRSPAYTNHNIPLDSNNFYRGVNAGSLDELFDASGVMRGYGKGGSDRLSFQSGFPNDLYVNGLVKSNMILEGDARMAISEIQKRSGYAFIDQLERNAVESGQTPLRVWQRKPADGQSVEDVHEWEKIFDSFNPPGFNTGGAVKDGVMVWPPEPVQPSDKTRPGGVPQVTPGGKGKNQIAIPDWSVPGTTFGPPPDSWWTKPINPDDLLLPDFIEPGSPWKHPPSKRIKLLGYAEGGQVTLEDLLQLDGVDPAATQHGGGQGAQPGPTPDQLAQIIGGQQNGQQTADGRTQGYVPAGAGNTGQAGSSFASGLLNMGSEAIGGVLDMAAQAASMAATVGSFGAGAAGGSQAAGAAISMGTQAAKRGVQYGFQMAGIGIDALAEILMPFGVPRFFQTDPTAFIPQLPGQQAAVTTGEKAELQQTDPTAAQQNPEYNPTGPVQPGQVNGMQPVGAPAAPAQGGGAAPGPIPMAPAGAPAGGEPPVPARPTGPTAPNGMPIDHQAGGPPGPASLVDPLKLGVFDRGGMLEPGALALNKSRRAEPMAVFTGDQWGTLKNIASQDVAKPVAGGGPDFSIHLANVTVKDVNELESQLSSKQRLQMMRYAGRP